MPIEIAEAADSRRIEDGLDPSREKAFFISGTDDEDAALAELKASAHVNPYGLLWANRISIEWFEQSIVGGFRLFRAAVQFGALPGGLGTGGEDTPTFSASTSTTTVRLFNAPVVNNYPAPGEPSVDFLGNINVTSDGVEGVDVDVEEQEFSLTISIPSASFTNAYFATTGRLAGTMNNAAWRGFAAREVKYGGMECSGVVGERATLTHRFKVSANATGLEVGPISGITKAGWDYLWAFSVQSEDPAAKMFRPKVLQVNVNRVCRESNFLLLGLGG